MAKKSTISHFPTGNGDMTLLKIASNNKYHYVLVDMHIRQNSEPDDDKCDVLKELYSRLETDEYGRPYVDVLILTHPDQDHIKGFDDNFHTGKSDTYVLPKEGENGKIFVNEIWSSPIIFRRKSKSNSLCEDAVAFNSEAKRRVNLYKKNKQIGEEGDRIRLIGKDEENKTDDIMDIVYENEDVINILNEVTIKELSAKVLGPLDDDEFEEGSNPDKNRSSIIIQWCIASHGYDSPTNYILLAGDAGVEVWELMWKKYKNNTDMLEYHILLAPHHCSWHALSFDSASTDNDPQVCDDAVSALSQSLQGAVIISSSDEINNDDSDPPNYQAMQEYKNIVTKVDGTFTCLADNKPSKGEAPEVLTYRLTNSGPQTEDDSSNCNSGSGKKSRRSSATSGILTGESIGHG